MDFYIWQPSNSAKGRELQLKYAGFSAKKIGSFENESMYKKNEAIQDVWQVADFEFPVQIISLTRPTFDIVETFPFSICQAWYTPERGIKLEKNFSISVKTGTIFKTNPLYSNADAYVKKIKERFGDKFKFVENKQQALEDFLLD